MHVDYVFVARALGHVSQVMCMGLVLQHTSKGICSACTVVTQNVLCTFVCLDMEYLRTILPSSTEEEFYDYMSSISTENIVVYAVDEGMVVFPKVPLMRIEGPLAVVQLLETTLLNLVNYARFYVCL